MDFDKCDDDDGFEEEEDCQYNNFLPLNQPMNIHNFVHYDTSLCENVPPEEVIFINDAQLHTYVLDNKDLIQESANPNNLLFYPQHKSGIGSKQIDRSNDGANMDNNSFDKKENNRERNKIKNNDSPNDDNDEEEVLIYDTQL